MTLQFALRLIRVHQICNRSSVFGELVQASQHLSNICSDTSVQKNQQAPLGVNSWKKEKKEKKNQRYKTKTLQNSLAKAPRMQRELKYLFDRRAGVTIQTRKKKKNTRKRSEMEGGCVLSSDSASTSNHFHALRLWPPGQNLAQPCVRPRWMRTKKEKKTWQTTGC